tara:strand:- start:1341 stop:1607 length:267 start_codon:yes stop_codon:yes gene_type:complete
MEDMRYGSQARHNVRPPTRAEINLAVAYYIMNGGLITRLISGKASNPIDPRKIETVNYIPYVTNVEDEQNLEGKGDRLLFQNPHIQAR